MTLSEDKEMIHIVVRRSDRDGVIKAIMEKAGRDTPAHSVVVALPVENAVGLHGASE